MRLRTAMRATRSFARFQLGAVQNVVAASLMVTRRCTLRCGYCSRHTPRNPELETGQWIQLLDELADHGCALTSFTGGEPLLRPDLGTLLEQARRRSMKVKLNTNGMLVEQNLAVVRLCDAVTISVDGPRDVHDQSRGLGSYDHALGAARRLRELGKPIRFYTVLSKDNLARLDELIDDAEALGATVFFQPGTATTLGGGNTPNPLAPSTAAYRATIDQLLASKRTGRAIGNSRAALRYLRQWPDTAPPQCAWRAFLRVEEDGNLRTCGRDTQVERINVATLGLSEALARRPAPQCTSCWTAARVELHLVAQGEPSALQELRSSG